ncbi:MAG: thioesterase family protein [Bacillota bacterium]|jgi:predicted thioesterase|nr:thioesterase family protein [Candidatus Fermentithermobacillaceae bacterium]
MKHIAIGAKGSKTLRVTQDTLASSTGSGAVDVFSTPNLVLLMEEACVEAVKPYLEEGETTVGTMVNIRHLAATPPGLTVTANAVLTHVEGRKLVFEVTASDDVELVGQGTHERFLVDREKFTAKSLRKTVIHKESHI